MNNTTTSVFPQCPWCKQPLAFIQTPSHYVFHPNQPAVLSPGRTDFYCLSGCYDSRDSSNEEKQSK